MKGKNLGLRKPDLTKQMCLLSATMENKLDEDFANIFKTLAITRENAEKGNYTEIKGYIDELNERLLRLEEDVKVMRVKGMKCK